MQEATVLLPPRERENVDRILGWMRVVYDPAWLQGYVTMAHIKALDGHEYIVFITQNHSTPVHSASCSTCREAKH